MIHYKIKEQARYSKIKSISDINKEKIYAAKRIRELKGGAHHEEQCMAIPNEVEPNEHGIYLEPCYKKGPVKLIERVKIAHSFLQCQISSKLSF